MSNSLSNLTPDELAKIVKAMGGTPTPIVRNPEHDVVTRVVSELRGAIKETMTREGVSVRKLAARRKVTPAVVSRILNGGSDMYVGTAALLAQALGYKLPSLRQLEPDDYAPYRATTYRQVNEQKNELEISRIATRSEVAGSDPVTISKPVLSAV